MNLNETGDKFMTLASQFEGNSAAVAYALGHDIRLVDSVKESTKTTPLHTAAYYGNFQLMDLLLDSGADPTRKSAAGCLF